MGDLPRRTWDALGTEAAGVAGAADVSSVLLRRPVVRTQSALRGGRAERGKRGTHGASAPTHVQGDRGPLGGLADSIHEAEPFLQGLLRAVEDALSLPAWLLATWQGRAKQARGGRNLKTGTAAIPARQVVCFVMGRTLQQAVVIVVTPVD